MNRRQLLYFRGAVLACICSVIAGCGQARQPESLKTVAAYEVPLPSQADHDQFLGTLRAAAQPLGLHVDAATSQQLQEQSKVGPAFRMTMNATVWRGANDTEPLASAMDQPDHLGQIWISFFRGEDPTLASRLRESAMREIMRHWPDTISLPIMPTGAIPLHSDLIRTSSGYIVNPSAAHKYELPDTGRAAAPPPDHPLPNVNPNPAQTTSCQGAAEKWFKEHVPEPDEQTRVGWGRGTYSSHFSAAKGGCFMEVIETAHIEKTR